MPFPLIPLAMLALSGYQYAKSQSDKKKAEAEMKKELASRPVYQRPQELKTLIADAAANRNAINPAIIAAQQQAQQAMANQQANAQRNASSGAEALAAGSIAQSNLQSFLPQLMAQQNQFAQQNRGAYYNALGMGIDDTRAVHQDRLAQNADRFAYQLGLAGAANAGRNQAVNNAFTIGGGLMSGGYNFGGNRTAQNIAPVTSAGNQYIPQETYQGYYPTALSYGQQPTINNRPAWYGY